MQAVRRIFVLCLVIGLSACATAPGPKLSGLAQLSSTESDVYVYRGSAIFAGGQAFDVALDGKAIGALYNGSYLHMRLPPGAYTLKVSPGGMAKSSELRIQAEVGKAAFFQYDFVTGLLANAFFVGASIQPREQARAEMDMKELSAAK